ncbi:putative serine/threonine-protein kinase [Heracleum sosnowskyi]|uniref:Serine/threonine-protein kinase n=1 Tax=Heracleum sosnowskyi TaxID=360622 RepID=A0AAD8MG58_9APIA|nr:putative serine/threonine-protein kinase [Heracleum sosnowskyi]
MGCVQARGVQYTPPQSLEKKKIQNGYVKGGPGGRSIGQKVAEKDEAKGGDEEKIGGERKIVNEEEGKNGNEGGNVSQRIVAKKIGSDELVDGWPKWLVDNMPSDVLAALVPKSADSYDKLSKVGQGTYSNVYKALDRDTGKIVALKKVRFDTAEPESIKFMAREIIVLQKLDHPNVIKLEGLATSRMQYSLYLVFEFMLSDLTKVISRPEGRLTEPQVKCYMQQLLSGLQHVHERGILHRDIKGSNLLIDKNGVLKIADFGLANFYEPKQKRPLTSRVVTLWYRAPELLLGSTEYGVGIDLWSAGCILAEMFIGRPIMPGRTEVEQLHRIFKLCGSPSEDYWRKIKPPTTFRPPSQYKPSFHEAFGNLPDSALALLPSLLSLEPAYRGTAASALQNEFFTSKPLACDLGDLPIMYKDDDLPRPTYRKKRRKVKKRQQPLNNHQGHERKDSSTDDAKDISESSREQEKQEEASSQSSHEMVVGALASSSRKQGRSNGERPPSLPYQHPRSDLNRSATTEAHPNALKNIKNFPILMASITETVNHPIEDNRINRLHRRSMSTVDIRTLDMEKISKLFGLEDR